MVSSFNGSDTVFIDPGSPWQNAWIESFNGRLRDNFLNGQRFDSLLEAQVLLEDWRIDYNINRPHSAHGMLTPVEFRRGLAQPTTARTRIAGGSTIGIPSRAMTASRQRAGVIRKFPLVTSSACRYRGPPPTT